MNTPDKATSYEFWREWFEYVWRKPTQGELNNRRLEVDQNGLPFEWADYNEYAQTNVFNKRNSQKFFD